MVNREIVMDYILSCLQDLVENGVEIKPDSDLVNDLGLESIKVMDLLMMLEDRFGNDSNLLIVFYVQIMPDDFVMQLHRF